MKTKAGKKVLLTLVCAALTIALGACSGDKAGKESSQITIGIPQDVDSLDPHKAVAAGTKEVLFNVFEGLVKPDSEGNLNDAVAESHTISEDGKVYTFTLRDGVKFHDGTTVTAEDVKYSIDRCADTSNGDPLVSAFLAIDSVNIIDEKTVEYRLPPLPDCSAHSGSQRGSGEQSDRNRPVQICIPFPSGKCDPREIR